MPDRVPAPICARDEVVPRCTAAEATRHPARTRARARMPGDAAAACTSPTSRPTPRALTVIMSPAPINLRDGLDQPADTGRQPRRRGTHPLERRDGCGAAATPPSAPGVSLVLARARARDTAAHGHGPPQGYPSPALRSAASGPGPALEGEWRLDGRGARVRAGPCRCCPARPPTHRCP
jgi:hypothetical protein